VLRASLGRGSRDRPLLELPLAERGAPAGAALRAREDERLGHVVPLEQ
jgi:hypothetical protein